MLYFHFFFFFIKVLCSMLYYKLKVFKQRNVRERGKKKNELKIKLGGGVKCHFKNVFNCVRNPFRCCFCFSLPRCMSIPVTMRAIRRKAETIQADTPALSLIAETVEIR